MRILLLDIDGLRGDVFSTALHNDRIPNIAKLVGGTELEKGLLVPVVAPAPSITFASQASFFTGAHPSQHGIPGNQFFDRFGIHSEGVPRHYAFDVGDTLAADDAVRVFTEELASQCLQVPTIYERFGELGFRSVVAGNMYARGAESWLKPSLINIARFTKGGNLFGMSSEEYDRHILDQAIDYIHSEGLPDVLTMYFMGLDHESHHHGPEVQLDHLANVIDPMIGELWDEILGVIQISNPPMVAIFSDHGQTRVIPDDRHSLRLAFPFEREMGHLFDALGLDVHDFPGEDPDCDAVIASNGGLAFVYLQNRTGRWADIPKFESDILSVGTAFWEAHATGSFASELEGALAGVLVRNVESDGWYAPYHALTPEGENVSLKKWFMGQPSSDYSDPVHRINNLVNPWVGDLLLISNYADGFYFSAPIPGMHGGLHPDDSESTLVYGFPGVDQSTTNELCAAIDKAIQKRCVAEGGRRSSTADLLTGLLAVIE